MPVTSIEDGRIALSDLRFADVIHCCIFARMSDYLSFHRSGLREGLGSYEEGRYGSILATKFNGQVHTSGLEELIPNLAPCLSFELAEDG